MLYQEKIGSLGISDPEISAEISVALDTFIKNARKFGGDKGSAVAWLFDHLSSRSSGKDKIPEIQVEIEMWQLDYSFGITCQSITPRLLLKVPQEFRDNSQKLIEQSEVGPPQNVPKLGWGGMPLAEDAVIIYPNQEGEEIRVEERTVVQWSGARKGEYFILGKIAPSDEKKLISIIDSVIGSPSEGKSIWEHYESYAKIEDLSEIMIKLREAGFSNQYCTDKDYYATTKPIDEKAGYTSSAGLYCRDKDRELCSAIYFPGEVALGFQPREVFKNGGWAVAIRSKNESAFIHLPVSVEFAKLNYHNSTSNTPLSPIENVTIIGFINDHPLRKLPNEFAMFLKELHYINLSIREKNNTPSHNTNPTDQVREINDTTHQAQIT